MDDETRNGEINLPRTSILEHASERVLCALETLARPVTLAQGQVLFTEGDEGDTLFAICKGSLEISVLSVEGRKLVLDVVTQGNLIGEIALFDPGVRTATAVARSPSLMLSISRLQLHDAIKKQPELGLDIIAMTSRRMRQLTERLQEQVLLQLPERLARKILYLTADGDPPSDVLKWSHMELAEFVGASRETVSKTLSQWAQAGIIEIHRQKICIRDRAGLRGLAGIHIS